MKVTIQTSTNCTLRCSYCYQLDKTSKTISFDTVKILLDNLFRYRATKDDTIFQFLVLDYDKFNTENVLLDFFGGECTLAVDILDQTCQYFEHLCDQYNYIDWKDNYKIAIETNGTTFLRPDVYRFYQKYLSHFEISISIDGCEKCHNACRKFPNGDGSYTQALGAVEAHKELFNTVPKTKVTWSLQNMQYIKESIEALVNLGYTEVGSSFDVLTELNIEQSKQYFDYLCQAIDYLIDNKIYFNWDMFWHPSDVLYKMTEPLTTPCMAEGSGIAVNYDGKLYSCIQLSESFTNDSATEQCLGTVWTGITEEGKQILKKFREPDGIILEPECFSCSLINMCGNCSGLNLRINKDKDHWTMHCGATIAETRARLYFAIRAEETDYPYLKDVVQKIRQYVKYDPTHNFLIYRKDK